MTELRRPALLDPRRHNREQFDSGEPVLDEWLRRYAGRNRRRDTAATWVITNSEDVVVAYASVAMTGIDRSAAPGVLTKGAPDPVPALLLGRLAVDRCYAGLGIGTALTAHVLATAVDLNEKAACRAVVVTALNANARAWWERLGFHPFDPNDPDLLDLYLLTHGDQENASPRPIGLPAGAGTCRPWEGRPSPAATSCSSDWHEVSAGVASHQRCPILTAVQQPGSSARASAPRPKR